jgi:AsmA protein
MEIGVKLGPLLNRRVEVEEITLHQPVIAVIRNPQGVLNISTLGKKRAPGPEAPAPTGVPGEGPLRILAMLAVDDLSLTKGSMVYRDQSAAKPAEYELRDLELVLKDVRLGHTPGLHVATEVHPFKLPITVDGTFGPLQETLDIKDFDVAAGIGNTVLTIKGSAVGGDLKLTLTSAHIDTADLPVQLSLKKPLQVKDLRLVAAAKYPLPQGVPPQDAVSIQSLQLDVALGNSLINVKGSAVAGAATLSVASPLISSPDVPVDLPLTKPVQVKGLQLIVDAKYPLPEGAPPLEAVTVRTLAMDLAFGGSVVHLKGGGAGGDLTLTATSSAINTTDVPVALPLKKPVEVKNLLVTAGLKGDRARLDNLLLSVFGGQVKASGALTVGTKPPPFAGRVALQDLHLGPALDAVGVDKVSISGTAATELDLHGRGFSLPELTRALEGTGHLVVRDGKIEGINVLNEVMALLKAAGVKQDVSNATVFSKIESNLSVKGGVVNVARLLIDAHDFLATGSGTIGFDQTLNMKATVSLSEQVSKSVGGRSAVGKVATTKGRFSVPIVITGSAQRPQFALDTAAVGAKVKEAVGELLEGTPEETLQKGKGLLRQFLGK